MNNFYTMPWQLQLDQLFTQALTPAQVQTRDALIREDDTVVNNASQNSALRLRSYATDGHPYRQEVTLAAGQAVGQVLQGSDRSLASASHITYADVIIQMGSIIHMRTDPNQLIWNYSPFNPKMNPTYNMPPGLEAAEDAFNLAVAAVPGGQQAAKAASLASKFGSMPGLSSIKGISHVLSPLGVDGAVTLNDPFQAWSTLTAQKVPKLNFAAIAILQSLFKGGEELWLCGAPGSPLIPTPAFLALMPLVEQAYDTIFSADIAGTVIGQSLQSMLLSTVPGLNLVA